MKNSKIWTKKIVSGIKKFFDHIITLILDKIHPKDFPKNFWENFRHFRKNKYGVERGVAKNAFFLQNSFFKRLYFFTKRRKMGKKKGLGSANTQNSYQKNFGVRTTNIGEIKRGGWGGNPMFPP